MFGKINKLYEKIKAIDQHKELTKIFDDKTLQAQIIDLNQSQLYDKGIQSDGSETGQYHHTTIEYKLKYGDARGIPGKVDHITGLDTGITYDSMRVESLATGLIITADDRNDFFKRENKGLGLTTESKGEILSEIKQRFIDMIKERIKK